MNRKNKNLPGEEPPHEADAGGRLVVAGHRHVDELGGRVDVAEGDDGDVGVAGLGDGLVVTPGVGDQQQARLPEGRLDLVSEGAGGEAAGDRAAPDVPGEVGGGDLRI